jgi:hypothetical protein
MQPDELRGLRRRRTRPLWTSAAVIMATTAGLLLALGTDVMPWP